MPAIVAVGSAVFLVVALVKPWGGPEPGAPEASSAPSSSPSLAAPSSTPAPTVGPAHEIALAAPRVSAASGALMQAITRGLVVRSGAWGIGAGGAEGSGDDAWVDWQAARPSFGDRSIELRSPPSCGERGGGSTRIRSGLVLALTVPTDLPPDWIVEAIRFDDGGRASFDDQARQVTPAGNRGIAYLYRGDGSAWPDGPYQLRILTSSRLAIIDACLSSR